MEMFLKKTKKTVDNRRPIGYNKYRRQDRTTKHADVAHLVERHLAKVEVASSSLVIRSSKATERFGCFFRMQEQRCEANALPAAKFLHKKTLSRTG